MTPSFVGQKTVAKTRASILFSPFFELIEGCRILELAPYDGWFTQELFNLGAKEVTGIEATFDFDRNFSRFKAEIEA